MSTASIRSRASVGSIDSLASVGSILSVGSVGSILSVGSAGSILSAGSDGRILCRDGHRMSTGEAVVHAATMAAVGTVTGIVVAIAVRSVRRWGA